MQESTILHGLGPEQLGELIRSVVRFELAQIQQSTSTQNPVADELLTVPQAAATLAVCKATVFEYLRRGLLPYTKIGKRTYLKRSDLLAAGTREQRSSKPARKNAQ